MTATLEHRLPFIFLKERIDLCIYLYQYLLLYYGSVCFLTYTPLVFIIIIIIITSPQSPASVLGAATSL